MPPQPPDATGADRLDDLAAIDALGHRGDPEVGMSQLALMTGRPPGHFDSAGVAQLVWSETPPYAGL